VEEWKVMLHALAVGVGVLIFLSGVAEQLSREEARLTRLERRLEQRLARKRSQGASTSTHSTQKSNG
jgi:hypothetical protein